MTYDEIEEKAAYFKIRLKTRAKNKFFNTPLNDNCKDLTRIEYMHNVLNNGTTMMVCYDGSNRLYTYVCSDTIECIEMVHAIGKSLNKEYTRKYEEEKIRSNSLLF